MAKKKKKKKKYKRKELAIQWNFLSHRATEWKIKESEKRNNYLETRELGKLWKMRVKMIIIVIGLLRTVTKGLIKWVKELEIRRWIETIQTFIEIGQNTEKSPGELRRLVVTQTPVKDHQLKLMWKTCKE